MTFNRRLDSIFPGMGISLRNDSVYLQTGIALSTTGQVSNPLPASGTFAIPFTAGRLRLRIYNGGGTTPTLVDLVVTAGDGTNNIILGASILHPTVAIPINATSWLEFEFEFILDVATSGAGGGASGQLSSVVGGANQMAVKTTLGGTTPTASMDVEIFVLI